MRIPKPIVFFALAIMSQPCLAQQANRVSLQFVSFPRLPEAQPVELLVGDGKTIEVDIPSNELSPTYQVSRSESWTLGKTEVGEDGKSKFTVFGSGKALASGKQLVVLIRKGPGDSDGFEVISFDNGAARLGARKFLFVNVSDSDLSGEIGGVKFTLEPGTQEIVAPEAAEGVEFCHAELSYDKEGTWKPFFSSNWPLLDKARGLIFIFNEPQGGRLRLHTIQDFP